ncbi:hypothetical protein [Adhaeretor mobilis]|uniref:Uncharacterized protein n=1 Tax=Adhaeretor mobilis TaxID=1930276 RepID=A0A517MQR2_9BACT|nr:hypothetical protein [Adhaeretor mobilis]QDS97212.1 hypothetical protein HG15A2_04720 [Adhaeretor mobilis]
MALATTANTPSLFAIYFAFEEATHRAYAHAVEMASGGVVTCEGILVGISELQPEHRQHVPTSVLSYKAVREDTSLPLVNEPALRNALVNAYLIAAAQSSESRPQITLKALLAAVLAESPWRAITAALFKELGLAVPTGLKICEARVKRTYVPPAPPDPVEIERQYLAVANAWVGLQDNSCDQDEASEAVRQWSRSHQY